MSKIEQISPTTRWVMKYVNLPNFGKHLMVEYQQYQEVIKKSFFGMRKRKCMEWVVVRYNYHKITRATPYNSVDTIEFQLKSSILAMLDEERAYNKHLKDFEARYGNN